MKLRTIVPVLLGVTVTTLIFLSCQHQPYVLPADQRTGDPNICFERDILPIFATNCSKSGCHMGNGGEGDNWTFTTYDNIIRKGIVYGNPAASKIYQVIAHTAGPQMPPKSEPALTQAQVDLISRWIATGAVNGTNCPSACDTTIYTYSGAVQPIMATYCTGCHYNGAQDVGNIRLDDYSRVKLAAGDSAKFLGSIRHTPGYVAMPQSGVQLSDCQVTQIERWIKNGMQND